MQRADDGVDTRTGVYGYDYNSKETLLESSVPEQAMRLAFRYGIRTLDTSPYYTTSERVCDESLDSERTAGRD